VIALAALATVNLIRLRAHNPPTPVDGTTQLALTTPFEARKQAHARPPLSDFEADPTTRAPPTNDVTAVAGTCSKQT
jgi:hypothetical protein